MCGWGQTFNWAAVAVAWSMAVAIGIAIYFLPIALFARQLDRVVEPTGACAVASRSRRRRSFLLRYNCAPSSDADWGDNMVEILKFSRETAFTPETIQILAAALDDAWERLRQSGSRLARPAYSRAMREVVAKRIMEMAQRGVQDREALVADALRFVTANYEEPSKQTS